MVIPNCAYYVRIARINGPPMRLKHFLLRFQPPGLALQYNQRGEDKVKIINLCESTLVNVDRLVEEIAANECLITANVLPQLREALIRIQTRVFGIGTANGGFRKSNVLNSHLLPITNIAINASGTVCATGSYDRVCKLWNLITGVEEQCLSGHDNVVYSVKFNKRGSKILTASFDKTARMWSVANGAMEQIFWGHNAEIVDAKFSPDEQMIATASLDHTAKVYQCSTGELILIRSELGQELRTFARHQKEVIALLFDCYGTQLATASFDSMIYLWDLRMKDYVNKLAGHTAEISNITFNQNCTQIASASLDSTAKLWDLRTHSPIHTFLSHTDAVLDIVFDKDTRALATASSDCTAMLWDTINNFEMLSCLRGHQGEISRISFSPITDDYLLTASEDCTARLWRKNGECIQIFDGHEDDVFSAMFSPCQKKIVTASKDNSCIIWTKI